jgi:GTP-binding protein Era
MDQTDKKTDSYCGFISIIGKPNVGKSTLLNKLVGEKISITANKPQTTRHKIFGIKTIDNKQAIYIDTPGIFLKNYSQLNKLMNKSAKSALKDVEIIMLVVDGLSWNQQDDIVLREIKKIKKSMPIFLLINKIDLISDHNLLLPEIKKLTEKYNFTEIFPISAHKNIGLQHLEENIFKLLPPAPHYFLDAITDKNLNFRTAEIIREKLIRNLNKELPYTINVEVVQITKPNNTHKIEAVIWVEKIGQKKIVIGENGNKLKIIGTQARLSLEKLFNNKVFLTLWVQVKANWTDNNMHLKTLNII